MTIQHEPPETTGYAQFPSKDDQRCSISGLQRSTLRVYLEEWKAHPVHPVRTLHLKCPGTSGTILLYNKADVYQLLNYEAEQALPNKKRSKDRGEHLMTLDLEDVDALASAIVSKQVRFESPMLALSAAIDFTCSENIDRFRRWCDKWGVRPRDHARYARQDLKAALNKESRKAKMPKRTRA